MLPQIVLDMDASREHSAIRLPLNSESSVPDIARRISSDSESMAALAIIEKEKNNTCTLTNEKPNPSYLVETTTSSSNDTCSPKQSLDSCTKTANHLPNANTSDRPSEYSSTGIISAVNTSSNESRPFTRTEHRDFVAAILDVGVKSCTPIAIMELLRNEDKHKLTREIMKSHLQKYRKIQDRGKGAFLEDYDLFQRKLENKCNKEQHHIIAAKEKKNQKKNQKKKKGTTTDTINDSSSDLGEAAIKKALGGNIPMNLVGGDVASLLSFTIANDCHENVLSSLNSTKVEVPVLTEAEKNTNLGRALSSIGGLLVFLKGQLQKSRNNSPTDSATLHHLISVMGGQVLRQRQASAALSAASSARAASKKKNNNKNNTANQSGNDRRFPTRRMSCPQPISFTLCHPNIGGTIKRRHSTMSSAHSFPQNYSQQQNPYQPSSTSSSSAAPMPSMGFQHPHFYGNPNMPPSLAPPPPMVWGQHPHSYQNHGEHHHHHHQYPPTYMNNNTMQPTTVHSVVYQPQQHWEPHNNPHHHQHPSTMQQLPQVVSAPPPPPPHAHWSYQQPQEQQQWSPSSNTTSPSNAGPSILPNHNQQLPTAELHHHHQQSSYKHNTIGQVATPPSKINKPQQKQQVFNNKEPSTMADARSPNVYDYFSDLEEEEGDGGLLSSRKRRKRSHSFSSTPDHGALRHAAYQPQRPPITTNTSNHDHHQQQQQQQDSSQSPSHYHHHHHHQHPSLEAKMPMAAAPELPHPDPFPPSRELRW